jgi:amino acid transporter
MDSPTSSKKRKASTGADTEPDQKMGEEAMPAELISAGSQHLHRKLGGKEIQLFAVGGAIGTCTRPGFVYNEVC